VPKYYTPAEANALLPRVRTVVERVRAAHRMLTDPPVQEALRVRVHQNGGGATLQGALESAGFLQSALKQLDEWGCVLRDPETGLLDFPALREGKEVWLCWLPDEDRVAFWHAADTGFAGRRPL